MKIPIFIGFLMGFLLISGLSAGAEEEGSNAYWRQTPGKLEVLEQKAIERDIQTRKVQELETRIAVLSNALDSTGGQLGEYIIKDNATRLQDLERKAVGYAAVQSTLKKKDEAISNLTQRLDEQIRINEELRAQIEEMKGLYGKLDKEKTDLQTTQNELQKTIEQFWLGNYEYYEVKTGDTAAGIAAMPDFYNDAAKDIWIRQANQGHVENIEQLRPGEVLIIPRFLPSGRYDF